MAGETGLYEGFRWIYRKSERIFEEGAPGAEMFIIHRGRAKIRKKTEEDRIRSCDCSAPATSSASWAEGCVEGSP